MFEDRGKTYYWGFISILLMFTVSVGFSAYCQIYASPVPDIAGGAVYEKVLTGGNKVYLTYTALKLDESLFYSGITLCMLLTVVEARSRKIIGVK